MKRISQYFIIAALPLLTNVSYGQEKMPDFAVLSGKYLGQKPPGMTPEIFAPGIISTELHEGSSGFNKDCLQTSLGAFENVYFR